MRLKFFAKDMTSCLREDIAAEAGRFWEFYIFNEEMGIHNCSITPDYECWPVGFTTDKPISDDSHEALMQSQEWDPLYYDCRGIDKIAKDIPFLPSRDPEDTDEEYLEEVIDWCRCNSGMFYPPTEN